MSQAHGDAETYARVLEHAPILKAPAGYVPGPDELDGLVRVGSDGWEGFIAPGPDAAQFIAEAIEPFLRTGVLDRNGVIDRLKAETPPALGDGGRALGDGGRALTEIEIERIMHVCDLMLMMVPRLPVQGDPRPDNGAESE